MFRYGTAPGQAGGVAVITAARLMRAACRVMLAWSSPAPPSRGNRGMESAMVIHSGPPGAASRQSWPLVAVVRGALAMIAVITVTGLAACGSAVGGGAGLPPAAGGNHSRESAAAVKGSAAVPLCAAARRTDRVVLSLTASPGHVILPRRSTISNAPRVRALAAALCALPPMPTGQRCPAALGGAVRLMFTAGGRGFQPVRIQDSGCPHVSGVGPARTWSWSSLPGRLLSEAVGGKGKLIPGTHPSSVPTP